MAPRRKNRFRGRHFGGVFTFAYPDFGQNYLPVRGAHGLQSRPDPPLRKPELGGVAVFLGTFEGESVS